MPNFVSGNRIRHRGPFPTDIIDAVVAQLVEHWLPKPWVAGSCPVYRVYLLCGVYYVF